MLPLFNPSSTDVSDSDANHINAAPSAKTCQCEERRCQRCGMLSQTACAIPADLSEKIDLLLQRLAAPTFYPPHQLPLDPAKKEPSPSHDVEYLSSGPILQLNGQRGGLSPVHAASHPASNVIGMLGHSHTIPSSGAHTSNTPASWRTMGASASTVKAPALPHNLSDKGFLSPLLSDICQGTLA